MFELVEVFEHLGRVCVIVRVKIHGVSHNGYVSVPEKHKDKNYDDFEGKIETDELTYGGHLESYQKCNPLIVGKWFVGFDSNHVWNIEEPETRTYESVRARAILLAEELVAKGF